MSASFCPYKEPLYVRCSTHTRSRVTESHKEYKFSLNFGNSSKCCQHSQSWFQYPSVVTVLKWVLIVLESFISKIKPHHPGPDWQWRCLSKKLHTGFNFCGCTITQHTFCQDNRDSCLSRTQFAVNRAKRIKAWLPSARVLKRAFSRSRG